MTTILIDESSKDGRDLIEFLRTKKSVTFLSEETDWWNTISQKERDAIEEGLRDIREGHTTPHEEVMKQYAQWL